MKYILFSAFLFLCLTIIDAQELSVEKIWKKYEFSSKGIAGFKSMNNGTHYTKPAKDLSILKYDLLDTKDAGTTLVDSKNLVYNSKILTYDDYEFNSDETKILFLSETKSVYRRSFTAEYFLFDITSKKLEALDEKHHPQTLAEYSPDGKMVSYIYGNDLFVKNLQTGKITKLTVDGKRNKVINGTTDWVYEEEFSITKAYAWSPDSKTIAFLRFNEKAVKEYSLETYGNLYPEHYEYKYPKAGEDNSKVTAHYVNVQSAKINNILLG